MSFISLQWSNIIKQDDYFLKMQQSSESNFQSSIDILDSTVHIDSK